MKTGNFAPTCASVLAGSLAAFLLFLQPAMSPSEAVAAENLKAPAIVTYEVTNYGKRENKVPVTFGAVFAAGDVPAGTSIEAGDGSGHRVQLQVDRKASNRDGSLRHAVLTLVLPRIATGATIPVTLRRAEGSGPNAMPVALSDIPPDFDASVILTTKGHRLTTSARAALFHAKPDTWLNGPYVTEWWATEPLRDEHGVADPHLIVQFGIRSYGKGAPLRVEVDVENDYTWVPHPQTEFYDAQITLNGKPVFTKSGMVQPAHTRWRKGFWWKEPIDAYVEQNLDYLKKTRAIPNYDPYLAISPSAVADTYQQFEASDRDPMGAGIIVKYMPTTGGRTDIAPLPQWQALYLLTMDPRMYQVMLQTADLGASFSSHYRNEKTGRPATLEDYPKISTHSNYVGKPHQLELPDTGGYTDPLVPDAAHEPALDFVPYLVTGDRFYLEEIEFWSQWNATGTAPEYHGFGQGLYSWDQVRAQAWSLRTLAQAEFIAPDLDPLKKVLTRELRANIAWYNSHFLGGADSNSLGLLWQRDETSPYEAGRSIAPWQDDFFTWTLGYIQSLGDVNALALLRWKARFSVGRMVGSGFCWILAPSYDLVVRDSAASDLYATFGNVYRASLSDRLNKGQHGSPDMECGGEVMAHALGLRPGEMVENAVGPDGYSAFLQPALAAAVDSGAQQSGAAWQLFMARAVKPNFADEPGWDIVPYSLPPQLR
ncbi:MAG TPA: hypothetical protein VHU23_09620 [Rhizomicrobium sp.]|nr:hypothetical protein [Rhizomicrobium sp.]